MDFNAVPVKCVLGFGDDLTQGKGTRIRHSNPGMKMNCAPQQTGYLNSGVVIDKIFFVTRSTCP